MAELSLRTSATRLSRSLWAASSTLRLKELENLRSSFKALKTEKRKGARGSTAPTNSKRFMVDPPSPASYKVMLILPAASSITKFLLLMGRASAGVSPKAYTRAKRLGSIFQGYLVRQG